MYFTKDQLSLIEILVELAQENHVEIALVGGVVRDLYLGHSVEDKDFDFVVSGDIYGYAEKLAKKVAGELQKFEKFLTAKVIKPKLIPSLAEIDLAHARKETYLKPGSLPSVVPAEIEHDLARRDFSINAMAIPLAYLLDWLQSEKFDLEELYTFSKDPFQGREDLAKKNVRVLHAQSFIDDPTRIFRALRYVARIDGKLEQGTENLLSYAVNTGSLKTISIQRILNELRHIFNEKNFTQGFELLVKYGVITAIELLPEDHLQKLKFYIEKLGQMKLGAVAPYEIFLRLCFSLLNERERQDFVKRIGIGRKGLNAFTKDLEFKESEVSEYSRVLREILVKK